MKISFKDKKLEKLAKDYNKCVRKMGSRRTDVFYKRLDDMYAAETLEDLRHLPGKFHELKEDRKGQWACSLDGPYRLIFEPPIKPIPVKDGKYIWSEIRLVEIIEIKDYH